VRSSIHLNALELSVNLGWPKGERQKSQIVILNAAIYFQSFPKGCLTDQLTDTHCYATLIEKIKNNLDNRHFRLLEHLGYEIHRIIKDNMPADVKVSIELTKKPAILNLTGGVTFCYGPT